MRNPNRHGSWIIILTLCLWSLSLAQTAPEIRQLEQDKPVERDLERIKALAATLAAVKTEDEGVALLAKNVRREAPLASIKE